MANIYDMIDTWNNGATTFTAIKMDVLDSASAANSLLLDLKVDGVTKASINKDGGLTVTTADINGGTIDDTVIGGSTAAAGTFTTLTASGDMNIDSGTLFVDASANAVGIGTSSPTSSLDMGSSTSGEQRISWSGSASIFPVRGGNSLCLSRGYKSSASVSGTFVGAVTGSLRPSMITLDGSSSSGRGITFYTDPTTSLVENATVTPSERMHIGNGGDISFYEDTGTTPKFFWDASAERLGLGTSSPAQKLDIDGSILLRGSFSRSINFDNGNGTSNFRIDFPAVSTAFSAVTFFRDTSTTGGRLIQVFKGDATSSLQHVLNADGDSYLNALTGNVGIGTSSPATKLDVNGAIRASTGILFGSDTAAANTLDDYEEGTWTPEYLPATNSFDAITYGFQNGFYTKIGRVVYCTVSLRTTLVTMGTASGTLNLTGLPFTVLGSSAANHYVPVGVGASFVNNPSNIRTIPNTTSARIQKGNTNTSLSVTDLTSGSGNSNFMALAFYYYTD